MKRKGFTLIELLIVVAIIAILAAIAVPNFLEAQTRAKVTRAISDMKTCMMAMEAYRVDHNQPPVFSNVGNYNAYLMYERYPTGRLAGSLLTTPIAYLTSIPWDYFNTKMERKTGPEPNPWGKGRQVSFFCLFFPNGGKEYRGVNYIDEWWPSYFTPYKIQFSSLWLMSVGPDLLWHGHNGTDIFYDPTNGAVSPGDLMMFEGGRSIPTK